MNCRLILFLTAFVSGANRLGAQGDGSSDPLGLPRTSLRCQKLSTTPGSTSFGDAITLRFEEGGNFRDARVMDAAYDSVGTPIYLSVLATRADSGSPPVTHALVARFGSAATTAGWRVRRSASDSAAFKSAESGLSAAASALEPMSLAEASQARALALWLWSHRCLGETHRPSPDK